MRPTFSILAAAGALAALLGLGAEPSLAQRSISDIQPAASRSPDTRPAHSGEPDDVVEAQNPCAGVVDEQAERAVSPETGDAGAGGAIAAARAGFERARARADAADQAYADMIRRDYPRGAEKAKIIEERDAAQEALRMARAALDAALANAGESPAESGW